MTKPTFTTSIKSKLNTIQTNSAFKKLIILTSMVILGLTAITGSINSKAEQEIQWNQEMVNNPESFLNVQFKEGIHLDNIIDNELTSINNNKGYNLNHQDYILLSLSGVTKIGGTEQLISINGNYSNKTIQKAYKDKLTELITKIDDIKNNNSKVEDITIEDQTKLDNQLSKMNSIELKAQRYFNWEDDKINTITIIGKTETLKNIESILNDSKHTKYMSLTETKTIKKQIENITKQTELMDKEEKQTFISILYTSTIKEELAKQGITDNIEDYMKKEWDKAPEYQKDAVELILEKVETESAETYVSQISNQLINGHISEANDCKNEFSFNMQNPVWGTSKLYLNRCAVGVVKLGGHILTVISFALGYFGCIAFCALLAVIIGSYSATLEFVDSRCNNGGAIINMRSGIFWINQRC